MSSAMGNTLTLYRHEMLYVRGKVMEAAVRFMYSGDCGQDGIALEEQNPSVTNVATVPPSICTFHLARASERAVCRTVRRHGIMMY